MGQLGQPDRAASRLQAQRRLQGLQLIHRGSFLYVQDTLVSIFLYQHVIVVAFLFL